ncbi:MAG: SGNH/GDSL hydrolase family protein [bacterium]
MKILFIGDSITSGKLGASFVKLIARSDAKIRITNLGNDGETLNIIVDRLLNHLEAKSDYDYLVFQGGYNDIILPYFREKGHIFSRVYEQQIKNGFIPMTNSNQFSEFLKTNILRIKRLFKGKIILLTIGCVGEDLNSKLNLQRNEFNEIIRNVAAEENIILADTQAEFDRFLSGKAHSSYCLDNLWAVIWWDKLHKDPDKLSKKRKLFLTIDGVHLNKKGAAIFADCILNKIH